MFSSKRTIAIAAISLTALGSGTAIASAATSVLRTNQSTETLISGRCYTTQSVTVSNFKWSSKLGHYVALAGPHTTKSHSTTCHK